MVCTAAMGPISSWTNPPTPASIAICPCSLLVLPVSLWCSGCLLACLSVSLHAYSICQRKSFFVLGTMVTKIYKGWVQVCREPRKNWPVDTGSSDMGGFLDLCPSTQMLSAALVDLSIMGTYWQLLTWLKGCVSWVQIFSNIDSADIVFSWRIAQVNKLKCTACPCPVGTIKWLNSGYKGSSANVPDISFWTQLH